jgi:thioester reductase-like protein
MASQIFLTGFPGFIAKRLVSALLGRKPKAKFTFLVEERMRGAAEQSVRDLDERYTGFAKQAKIVTGDITQQFLGMGEKAYDAEAAITTHVWHLAAIYDLAVAEALAYRVNVVGTANVLDFCEECEKLERLDYVSTCYVSGLRTGRVLETELDEDQQFKNHYESTKCWAEIEVRRRMYRVPTAIYRPGIVVGDSKTGYTDKYDGPYYMMTLLNKLPSWLPMVNVGEGNVFANMVPVDFIVDAMAALAFKDDMIGECVQLADPNPHLIKDLLARMMQAFGFRKPLVNVSSALVEKALDNDSVRNLVKIPTEALVYFNFDVSYDTSNQQRLLQGTGVSCPDFFDYLPTLAAYVKQNPEKPFLDGRAF